MSTNSRLSTLINTVPIIPFDESSKFVIMSDCHRGIGTWSDNFMKNQNLYFAALTHYNHQKYTYIELGDGDELWENRSMEQIINLHSDAFWIMSRFYEDNRLYMVYGNHDCIKKKQKFIHKNCKDFYCESSCCRIPLLPGLCVHEGLLLKHSNEQTLFLVHGHQGDLLNDTLWKFSRFLVRYIWRPLELLALHDPTSAAKNYHKKGAVEQRLINWTKENNQILVAGHTHRPVFPTDEDFLYFNCGSCVHPRCITALEIEHGNISLVKWSEKTDDDLSLYVGRDILAGPSPI